MYLDVIYNEDCLEGMKKLPNGCIDMILCDLPYGVTRCRVDKIIPFEPLWEQYKRVIKENGAIVLFGTQPFTSLLVCSNPKMFKYEWIYAKTQPSGHLNAKRMPMKYHENILVFYKKQPTYARTNPITSVTNISRKSKMDLQKIGGKYSVLQSSIWQTNWQVGSEVL